MERCVSAIVCCALIFCVFQTAELKRLYPVILIPGDAGSQVEGKWDKPSKPPHIYCSQVEKKYTTLWLNEVYMIPGVIDCWADNFRLVYNRTKRTTNNSPGVATRVPGFGDTRTVEWLVPNHILPDKYSVVSNFNTIVETLVKLGYKRNATVRAAPYDFRKAPNEMAEYYKHLKQLVEVTYKENNNTKVVIIAHSMGNPVMLYFYNHIEQAWKDKYIQTHIGLAGVWAGSVKLLRLFASGEPLGPVHGIALRREQRSMPSSAWLLPSDTTWNADEVLVVGPKRNYTLKDYQQFFHDIGFMDGWYMREDTKDLVHALTAPGVEVHCLHGTDLETPGVLIYNSKTWPDTDPPKIKPDNGDGSVNIRSLTKCLTWQNKQSQKIFHQEFPKVEHRKILHDPGIIQYIKNVLSQ